MIGLPKIQDAVLEGKVVLVRVDHNVVKKGKIDDPYRIERSKKTIEYIREQHGFPVLMTHVGRPKDEKTGNISINEEDSVHAVVEYLKQKWGYKVLVPEIDQAMISPKGLPRLEPGAQRAVESLKDGQADIVYLNNTRWYTGEEDKEGRARSQLTSDFSALADVFVNDAFGSHQAHASTFWIARELPSFAGFLLQEEIEKLYTLIHIKGSERPFLAIVAGEKISTKIGALSALRKNADALLLGGLPLNAVLAARFNVAIHDVSPEEVDVAKRLLEEDKAEKKLLIPDSVVVSQVPCSKDIKRREGSYQKVTLTDGMDGKSIGFVYDVHPGSISSPAIRENIAKASTIFTNAVMGFDKAGFVEGTQALYGLLSKADGKQYFGGGDTLKALQKYAPELYQKAVDTPERFTLFTGGGTILTGFESRGVEQMKVIQALMESKKKFSP